MRGIFLIFAFSLTLIIGSIPPLTAGEQVRIETQLAQPVILKGAKQKSYLTINLEGLPFQEIESRVPVNVALVVDKSGSMRGAKLDQAKQAAIMALNRLGREDVLSVVAYNHNVDIVFPATQSIRFKRAADKIRRFRADGRTALYAGVEQGLYQVEKYLDLEQVNRVILLSDGLANVGPRNPGQIARLGEKAAEKGVAITTIGLGLGFNEDLMTKLAFSSDGNHAFVEHPEDLVSIFNSEFGDVLSVVAQQIEIIIEFEHGYRPVRSLGRNSSVRGNKLTFKLNQLYGKQTKRVVVEFEQDGQHAAGRQVVAKVSTRYKNMADKQVSRTQSDVHAEYTESSARAEKSIDRKVMTSVVRQIAIEANEKAVSLRDKGQVKEAKQLLESNASYLREQADKLSSKDLEKLRDDNLNDAAAVSSSQWNKQRKAMRARQYKGKTQQSY